MFTFFQHIGVAIVAIFATFTGAFHSQPAPVIQAPVTQQQTVQVITTATSTPPVKEEKKTVTVVSPSTPLVSNPVSSPVITVTTPTPSTFTTTFPVAGTVLNRGNSYNVTWSGSDPDISEYSIFLTRGANGNTSSTNLGVVLASDKSFSWSISDATVPTDGYYLKFVSGSTIHQSPSFTITSNIPTVTAITQNQNSNVPVDILVNGGTYYLTGKSFTDVDSVYLANSWQPNAPLSFFIIDDNDINLSMPCQATIPIGQYSIYVASTKEGTSHPIKVTVGSHDSPGCSTASVVPVSQSVAGVPSSQYGSYPQLTASGYTKNPPQYFNQGVEISPLAITDFLYSGGSGGTHNYLHAGGNTNISLDLMLEIDNPSDYQSIVSNLNKNDYIIVFGLGQASQPFTISTTLGVRTNYYATLSVQRIDKCQSYKCSPGQTTTIFSK